MNERYHTNQFQTRNEALQYAKQQTRITKHKHYVAKDTACRIDGDSLRTIEIYTTYINTAKKGFTK